MQRIARLAAAACLLTFPFASSAVSAEPDDGSRRTLAEFGVEPTMEGIGGYLASLEPTADEKLRIETLVRRLGDDDFFRREDAMTELLRMPSVSLEHLERAAAGDDAEIRWRARRLIEHGRGTSARILFAAYRVIEQSQLKGLGPPVLLSMAHGGDDYQRRAAVRALAATVLPEDAPLLRKALAEEAAPRRIAAVTALVALLGDAAQPDLKPLLATADEEVRYHAAIALVNQGVREALPALGKLLESENVQVRAQTAQSLRALSGESIAFVAYEAPEKRRASARLWQEWIAAHGATAELKLPVGLAAPLFNRTLVCYYNPGKVVEIDAAGKQLWEVNVAGPWGCEGLPNGNRLIASYNNRTVVEYDPAGKEIWKATLPSHPFSVQRVDNGNTLVACYGNRTVLEIRPDKQIAWQIDAQGQPMDARRLDDGNTLVCLFDQQKVVEFDREGKIVWEVAGMQGPRSARRLDNGNTLIVQSNARSVVEVDRQKRVVWSKTLGNNLFDAQRLPNGNTLIGDQQGVQELDPEGNVVWKHNGMFVGRLSRY
ncbi:MAG: PQQ-binding-like beta-propeller repeat protein [Planctomycetales bacterium]